jgi:Winged helix-turn helix
MPVPRAPQVSLAEDEQCRLESIVRAHSTPQALSFRCQLILRTAAPDRPSNLQVAQELNCDRHTVGRWRSRYLAQGLSGLQDAPRPGRPRRCPPLSASGGDGDGHPSTCPVPLRGPPLESRRLGFCPGTGADLDHESVESLASAGGGGPHTAPECLLAQQPRARFRAHSARSLCLISQRPPLLCAGSCGHLHR